MINYLIPFFSSNKSGNKLGTVEINQKESNSHKP